jgi:hypothetical protein
MNSKSPFCGNCGGPLRGEAKFCHRCGVDIDLYKSIPAISKSLPGRGTESYSSITGERICLLSDKNLQAQLEREMSAEPANCSTTDRQRRDTVITTAKLGSDPKSGRTQTFPFVAAVVIIAVASLAVLGGIGAVAWASHKGFFGKSSLNSSLPPDGNSISADDNVYVQSYEAALTTKTKFPERAIGAPDGQFAVIQPNGRLTFQTKEVFADVPGADIQVIGQAGNNARYKISCWDMDQNKWQRIDFGVGQGDHDMGHHQIKRSNQIQIENVSTEPLMIDAVRIHHQ